MKRSTLSTISALLVALMLLGAFASCTSNQQTGTESETGSTATESGSEGSSSSESTSSDGSESKAPEESSDENDSSSESETAGSEEKPSTTPTTMSNAQNIQNAAALMNGVNAYFTDGKRTDFVLENQNMTLSYALAAGKKQQVTSLVNTKGQAYITNTSDVFVTMTNGNTIYASNSTRAATANLYRFGYYMYEARFEEQNFIGITPGDKSITLPIDANTLGKNQAKLENQSDGSVKVTVTNTVDPYILFKNVNYSAADYPYMMVTLKASIKSQRSLTVYVQTDSHSMGSTQSSIVSASDEYMTYMIPLYKTSWYTGQVTSLRLDFPETSQKGETYEIKEIKLVSGNTEGLPENLGLNRSYFIYSNKLHHVVQIASANVATENIASIGVETRIAKNTVAKVVVKDKNGVKYSFDGVDWDSAEYVGFDVNDAGIFGYILPAGEKTDKLEVIENGDYYVIIQSRTPENGAIQPSGVWNEEKEWYDALVDDNANDFYMGQRLYTDESHDFAAFLLEAYIERNPLGEKNFILNKRDSSYICTYECPECGEEYDDYVIYCTACFTDITPISHPNMYYKGYDALRGIYTFHIPGESFNAPYFQYPNKYVNLSLSIKGDEYDRMIYFMPTSTIGCLECAAILDENKMMLPIPLEVGKNFSEGGGERNLYNIQDNTYSETIVPLVINANTSSTYTILNLYQNWGQYPLKQVSWIQFYAPYYHLSTGVTESNCIVPYYSCKNSRGLGTLPDHRAMSAHLWAGQPQHTSGGSHRWLMYTDANGVFSASENTLDYIDSYGPIYADVYMDYLSDDGKIKVSYTHMEFPQTDENRAFYEMKYEVLEDVSFKNFAEDFCFYDLGDNDSKGSYKKVGYLNADNVPTIVASTAATGEKSAKYVLGTECPYFSFFDMPDYDKNSTSAEGFVNLSFIIHSYDIVINGQKSDAKFCIINQEDRVSLSLDLEKVTLKKGDTITINAIVMPWGDEELDYSVVGDKNVRDVRENTCLNPLTPTAMENAEVIESVFLPRIKTTNGKSATFNLKGGQNNVAVRVYGFNMLTVPKIEELVDGNWVEYRVSSAYKPDAYGYAHYFDGYSVHYDEDGTLSYAFIVPMDYTDADGRTFRVTADTEFTGWPKELPEIEIDNADLPMNVLVSASDIFANAKSQCGSKLGGLKLSADGSYVTLSSNAKADEAYFHLWRGNGGKTVTGQYFVLKYRLPATNNRKYTYTQFYTSTDKNSPTAKNGFSVTKGFINDGEWHTLVIDFSTWGRDIFAENSDGEFKVIDVRFDVFNDYFADGNDIDIAFFGISDSLEEILAYYQVDTINLLTAGTNVVSYDKQGNEIETPSDSTINTSTPGFNLYLDATAIADAAAADDGHIGKTVQSSDGKYVTLYAHQARLESYITLFSGNRQPTGQYLIIKYRSQKQAGSIEFYCSTEAEGAKSGLNFKLNNSTNYTFIADSEWHTVVVDLAGVLKEDAFKANAAGEYIAKFIRIDLFNFDNAPTEDFWVDIAYVGFSDNYEDAISHDENTWFYDGKQSINVSTGEPLTGNSGGGSGSGDIQDATSSVPGYNVYLNATSITTSGKNTAWKDYVVLSSDSKYSSIINPTDSSIPSDRRLETYFTCYTNSSRLGTGQYVVIKYRSNVQQGSITLWSSTENEGPVGGNNFDLNAPGLSNGLFIADNEWHIVIVDLSKFIASYSPNGGKYAATHLRVDFFNFGSPRNPEDTQAIVDVAYIGICDDYTEILCSDKSVSEVIFFNGSTYKYSTETGDQTSGPAEGEDEPTKPTNGYNKYYNATSILEASQVGGGHLGGGELIESSEAARLYNCVDATKPNAARVESYFTLLSGNTSVTGQYLVLKYRAQQQVGYIEIYTSTQNKSASGKGVLRLYGPSDNGLFVADNEWHIVVIDLSKTTETFTANTDGKYIAQHLRIDLFNFGSPSTASETAYVDLAYVGLCEDFTSLLCSDKSVSEVVFFDGEISKYSTETGEQLGGKDDKEEESDESGIPGDDVTETEKPNDDVTETEKPNDDVTESDFKGNHFNATSIIMASQIGGGHLGGSELIENSNVARIYNCVDPSKPNVSRLESYFHLLSSDPVETGRYLAIKYRAEHQVGYMQIYTSTVSANASGGGNSLSLTLENGLFIADGEWKIVIIDLEKAFANYKSDANGKYFAKHLRIDLFNFGTPRENGETAYVDIAYIDLSNDLGALIKADTSVQKASFYDGSLKEYFTENGDAIKNPNFVIGAAGLMTQTEGTGTNRVLSSTDNCVTYSHKADSSDNYIYMIFPNAGVNVPKDATGQYIMIKYRTESTHKWRFHIGANNGSNTATGGKDSFSVSVKNGENGGIIADGEWQYLIIDTATFLKEWGGVLPEDGTDDVYRIDYMRIGFFDSNTDKTVEIQYIAFAETLDQLETYGDMDSYTLLNNYAGNVKNETITVTAAE